MDKRGARAWFEAFCRHPVIYHSFHYAIAVHRDVVSNRVLYSNSQEILAHKTQAIRLLNAVLAESSDAAVDMIILTTLLLATTELQQERIDGDLLLLFDPHLPTANWISVYGRIETVKLHARAMMALVIRKVASIS